MTRIIAGAFGGRRLVLPADRRVRPTADRVREAWFSILAPKLEGASVLDLFAGSGALGFEALSRGARAVVFVEINQPSISAIDRNATALDVASAIRIVRKDALKYLDQLVASPFDVAVADPPYGMGLAGAVAERFLRSPFARVLGVEHGAKESMPGGDTRRYGDTAITFYHDL